MTELMRRVSFNNSALAIPAPVLGPECVTALYDQTPLNNGYWNVVPTPASGYRRLFGDSL
jgi:hypothetical protein